jgi:dynein heavy chain
MPAREPFGAQPPIELLRQLQDYRGFYDRKGLFWKDVEETVLCAACAPPGGGRQEVTPRCVRYRPCVRVCVFGGGWPLTPPPCSAPSPRFLRHFTMLSVPPPSDAATKSILSSILGGFLSDFPPDLKASCAALVNASVEAYGRISEGFLPTPAKSHYTFNMRDLSKVSQRLTFVQIYA